MAILQISEYVSQVFCSWGTHRVVKLDPFLGNEGDSTNPVHSAFVDWEEYFVHTEQVTTSNLLRPAPHTAYEWNSGFE